MSARGSPELRSLADACQKPGCLTEPTARAPRRARAPGAPGPHRQRLSPRPRLLSACVDERPPNAAQPPCNTRRPGRASRRSGSHSGCGRFRMRGSTSQPSCKPKFNSSPGRDSLRQSQKKHDFHPNFLRAAQSSQPVCNAASLCGLRAARRGTGRHTQTHRGTRRTSSRRKPTEQQGESPRVTPLHRQGTHSSPGVAYPFPTRSYLSKSEMTATGPDGIPDLRMRPGLGLEGPGRPALGAAPARLLSSGPPGTRGSLARSVA